MSTRQIPNVASSKATAGPRIRLSALIAATVEALKNLGGSASNEEILDDVVVNESFRARSLKSPIPTAAKQGFFYRLHWARTYLKKVGAAENTERGVWTLTPKGRAMTAEEMAAIVPQVRHMDREARKARKAEVDTELDEEEEPIAWSDRLLTILHSMPADAFERLCQRLLRESGFMKVEVTGRSGDGGIDGNGVLRMNLVSFRVIFQAKKWRALVRWYATFAAPWSAARIRGLSLLPAASLVMLVKKPRAMALPPSISWTVTTSVCCLRILASASKCAWSKMLRSKRPSSQRFKLHYPPTPRPNVHNAAPSCVCPRSLPTKIKTGRSWPQHSEWRRRTS